MTDPKTPFRIAKQMDIVSVQQRMALTKERIEPLANYPGYFISNTGVVYSSNGSTACLYCGNSIEGNAAKKFCNSKCRSSFHYQKQVGNESSVSPSLTTMALETGSQGHQRVMLYKNSESHRELVHRLVLATFDREPSENEQACHKDGNPQNNHIANLRWGSQSDNWKDRIRHGNRQSYTKITQQQASEIRNKIAAGIAYQTVSNEYGISDTQIKNIVDGTQWKQDLPIEFPLKSVWLGVSVENQKAASDRIPLLLQTPAAKRFLSCEPLLGKLDLSEWLGEPIGEGICDACGEKGNLYAINGSPLAGGAICTKCCPRLDWVICGGESGALARPCHVGWLRSPSSTMLRGRREGICQTVGEQRHQQQSLH